LDSADTHSKKNPKIQWGFEPPNPPSGYATEERYKYPGVVWVRAQAKVEFGLLAIKFDIW